jgi:Ser/Thr protein kinase RdoA (MazF antagonist)
VWSPRWESYVTRDQDFKTLVRDRMTKTGESYTTARKRLLEQRDASSRGLACGRCGAPIEDAASYRRHLEKKHGYEGPPAAEAEGARTEPEDEWFERIVSMVFGDDAVAAARAARNGLADHLARTYATNVTAVTRLEGGVFRVDRKDGPPWVARVLPLPVPQAQVRGDAAVLHYLESIGFPAERCALESPVSTLKRQGVLVTEFIDGGAPDYSPAVARQLGDMLGRLHALPDVPRAVARPAARQHSTFTASGGWPGHLAAAARWLDAVYAPGGGRRSGVARADRATYDSLRSRLARADACADLPMAFTHPDLAPRNVVAQSNGDLVAIDWTGAGLAPRVAALATLVWQLVVRNPAGPNLDLVGDAVAGYRDHVRAEPNELDRLAAVVRSIDVVLDCFYFGIRMSSLDELEAAWPAKDAVADAIAGRVQEAFAN